jgi:hypothetical protein
MTLIHNSFTVETTPTLIATIPAGNPTTIVSVVNDDNSSIYIGDITVSASSGVDKGLTVTKNTVYNIPINARDSLYAISAAGTAPYAVSILYSTVVE